MKIKTIEGNEFESQSSKSILESALQTGHVFEYSCKTGLCGVCKTSLLEGDVKELQPQLGLDERDKENGKILTCCCEPVSDILIDAEDLQALQGIETKTFPVRVNRLDKHSSDIIEVELRFPPTADFKFLEGQYLDVIWNGVRRSYSIASTSHQKEVVLLIKRFENGLMSQYWFEQAKVNDLLRIEGPKGTFYLREPSNPLLFLATGTGVAPIISILSSLDRDPDFKQENPIVVFWGNRFEKDFVWEPEFKNLDVRFIKVCSKASEDWQGSRGYVQEVAVQELQEIHGFDVYACGSNDMIKASRKLFIDLGLAENKFYSDAFVQSY